MSVSVLWNSLPIFVEPHLCGNIWYLLFYPNHNHCPELQHPLQICISKAHTHFSSFILMLPLAPEWCLLQYGCLKSCVGMENVYSCREQDLFLMAFQSSKISLLFIMVHDNIASFVWKERHMTYEHIHRNLVINLFSMVNIEKDHAKTQWVELFSRLLLSTHGFLLIAMQKCYRSTC